MFARNVLGTIVWIGACAFAARFAASAPTLSQHPTMGNIVVYSFILIAGFGGLWGFWNCTWAYDFLVGGYRVRWAHGSTFIYEEFGPDEMLRSLAFGYVSLAPGYAPPCQITLPTDEQWPEATPAWVQGRREELVHRLASWARRGHEPTVTFVPPGSLETA